MSPDRSHAMARVVLLTRAEKTIEKEIDVDSKEFKRELDEAEKEYAAN